VLVAGLVIETVEGAAARVSARLLQVPSLEVEGGDGVRRIAAVVTAPDAAALEALGERLVAGDEEILGVFPTYVGEDAEP
jgi:nitrate reductase NapAB chaperone NapD